MQDHSLQSLINTTAAKQTLSLLPSEYQGPAVISRSMVISGAQGRATIWAIKGPALTIKADDVALKDLLIEITGDPDSAEAGDACAIKVEGAQRVKFENVTVRGTIIGLAGEEGIWHYPVALFLGLLTYGTEHFFEVLLQAPQACQIKSEVAGIEITPQTLVSGLNTVTIHVERLPKDTLLDGFLSLETKNVSRKIRVTAHVASSDQEGIRGKHDLLWQPAIAGGAETTQPSDVITLVDSPGQDNTDPDFVDLGIDLTVGSTVLTKPEPDKSEPIVEPLPVSPPEDEHPRDRHTPKKMILPSKNSIFENTATKGDHAHINPEKSISLGSAFASGNKGADEQAKTDNANVTTKESAKVGTVFGTKTDTKVTPDSAEVLKDSVSEPIETPANTSEKPGLKKKSSIPSFLTEDTKKEKPKVSTATDKQKADQKKEEDKIEASKPTPKSLPKNDLFNVQGKQNKK